MAVCLVGGLLLAAAAALGFWAGTVVPAHGRAGNAAPRIAAAPKSAPSADRVEAGAAGAAADPGPRARPAGASGGGEPPRRSPDAEDATADEAAVFAALERLERRMAAGMSRARDSVVALEYSTADSPPGSRRLATGVVVNSSGDVLSVRIDPPSAANPTPIVARDASGRRHPVQWIAADPETGLTLLRIAPNAVKPIVIAQEGPTLGSQVVVVGNPFGLGHSVSRGHVAGLDRALKLGQRQIGGLIQVQAPLYPGDSGAAVTDLRGQLLGLIRSGLANPAAAGDRAERENDFGFAIATRDLLWVADHLRARGKVDRAYLGVRLHIAPAGPASSGSPDPKATAAGPEGAWLEEVFAETPAAKAGLQSGDTIIAIDGEPIHTSPDLTDRLDRLPAQTNIQLDVLRGQGPARKPLRFVLRTTSRPDLDERARAPAPTTRLVSAKSGTAPPIGITATAAPGIPAEPGQDAMPSAPAGPRPLQPASPAHRGPAPAGPSVTIPAPVRSPLRTPVPPAQAEELKLIVPQVVTDQLNQLERRLETLERQVMKGPAPETARAK
jgi:S1-C subfamily serine protease